MLHHNNYHKQVDNKQEDSKVGCNKYSVYCNDYDGGGGDDHDDNGDNDHDVGDAHSGVCIAGSLR